jgi:sugar-specific transcriptional regulator TrmB
MSFQSSDISLLVNAGLTISQAKIYLTLVLNGKQTIKFIAKLSGVDRSNTYREIMKLEELALVKKIIGIPNMFQAISLAGAISLLLAERQKQCEKTKKA